MKKERQSSSLPAVWTKYAWVLFNIFEYSPSSKANVGLFRSATQQPTNHETVHHIYSQTI